MKRLKRLKKTKITNQTKLSRINYANRYLNEFNLNNQLFKQHVYTDESIFTNGTTSDYYRTFDNTYYSTDNYTLSNLNQIKVNVYGILTPTKLKLIKIDDNFDQKKFRELLINKHMLLYMNSMVPNRMYLVQDNSSVHEFDQDYNHTILDECRSKGIELINLPKYSPDMNILENLWALLKLNLAKSIEIQDVINQNDLFIRLNEIAEQTIDINYINQLYNSLPDRLSEVIKLKGNLTRY